KAPRVRNAACVVLDVRQIAPEFAESSVTAEEYEEEVDVILRPDLEPAPDKEASAVDPPANLPFFDQQTTDQKAAEDKEDVDAHPAEVLDLQRLENVVQQSIIRLVKIDDKQNRDAANEIQLDLTPKRSLCSGTGHVSSIRVWFCSAYW